MKTLPLQVLLLGWDELPKAEQQPRPGALALAQRLAPALTFSVLLPHLPEETETPIPQTQITGLGNLDPQQLAAAQRPAGTWQAPASPYVGAEHAAQPVREETEAAASAVRTTAASAEAGAEPGPAEARALSQPEADDTQAADTADQATAPAAPAQTLVQALAALRTNATADADLNFRVIQYARFAAPQAAGQKFAVIYAAEWPVWLAALEIRQLTGRPLVLHVHSLAADRSTDADRGWALELERLTLRRATLLLASSAAVAERLKVLYNFPADRCRVVDPNDTQALHEVLNSFTPAG